MIMEYEEIAALPTWAKETEIPITGLYGMKFLIVKIKNNKYVLYRGEKQTNRNFIGVYSNLDDLYEGVSKRCKKERCDKCQTKLKIE